MTQIILLLLIILSTVSYAQESPSKGLYVWSLDQKPVLAAKSQIDGLIEFARAKKIQTLYIQVYRANKAWFPTKHADTKDYDFYHKGSRYDSFSYLISQAHLYGIEVYAWMNMLSLSANVDAPMLKKYGMSILTTNLKKKKTLEDYKIDKQYFLEPSDPRVHKELLAIIEDLLKAHMDLDGIQFDYIRYPDVNPSYGYSPENVKRFKKSSGVKEIVESDPKWKQWKRDQVTELLKELVKKTKSINSKVHVSTTGCLSYGRAMDEALQDWPSWISKGLVEHVTVMNYPPNLEEFQKNVEEIKDKVSDFNKVNIAIGAYKFVRQNEDVFEKQFSYCLASEFNSCVFFHYGNFVEDPVLASRVK